MTVLGCALMVSSGQVKGLIEIDITVEFNVEVKRSRQ